MNIYDNILNCPEFCDTSVEKFSHPFRQGDYCAVTDGKFLIIVPNALVDGKYELQDKLDLRSYTNQSPNCSVQFTIKDFKDAMNAIPVCDTEVCDACKGQTTVFFRFEYNGKLYTQEYCCPICCGDGRTDSPIMIKDDRYLIKINTKYITLEYFRKLLKLFSLSKKEEITLAIQDNYISGFIMGNISVFLSNKYVADEEEIQFVILKRNM